MNIKSLIPILGVAFLVVACDNPVEERQKTVASAANPEVIATLPDGRTLHRLTVFVPNQADHFVYFFRDKNGLKDTSTVSVNYSVPTGKTSYNQTVVIDGKTYELVPK